MSQNQSDTQIANIQITFGGDLRTHVGRQLGACLASANGESRQYALHLKGFVGGADFDRNYVDYVAPLFKVVAF